MYVDKTLQFSADQVLTATAASDNSINLGANRPVGPGETLWLVVVAKSGLTGTNPTLTIGVETDDSSSFGSVDTPLVSGTLTDTTFPTGTIFAMPWPMISKAGDAFARVKYTVGGTGGPTATVDAFLTNQPPPTWQPFPDAI